MRSLAIDARAALVPHPTGKGQWLRGFLRELLTRDCDVTILADGPVPPSWQRAGVEHRIFAAGPFWHLRAARFLRQNRDRVVYFSPTSFLVPFLVGRTVPTVPLVHDLIAFLGEPHDRKATVLEHLTLGRTLRTAAAVCTISEATRNALLSRFPALPPHRIAVISAGPSEANPPLHTSDQRSILTVGTLCPRKNQLRLIQAFALLPDAGRRPFRLIIAGGRGWHDQTIVDAAASTPGVEWLGYVTDQHYHDLLRTCHVFAFPSLEEGFGLPVLDALQRGIPVLTSTRGGLTEVAGKAALTVDPEDTGALCRGLLTLLRDADLRERLRRLGPEQARKFSWKNTVGLFLKAVQPLL